MEDEICKTCNGTGEVSTMGRVYADEPHMGLVDTEPCPDCLRDEEDFSGATFDEDR